MSFHGSHGVVVSSFHIGLITFMVSQLGLQLLSALVIFLRSSRWWVSCSTLSSSSSSSGFLPILTGHIFICPVLPLNISHSLGSQFALIITLTFSSFAHIITVWLLALHMWGLSISHTSLTYIHHHSVLPILCHSYGLVVIVNR